MPIVQRLTDFLTRPRCLGLLLAVGLLLGTAHALIIMPLSVITGTSDFWDYPRGTVPGGSLDMAQALIGNRYLQAAPWMLPFLHIPNLVPPEGTNAVWLDPVPLVGLIGRTLAGAGHSVNLLGWFLFLSLSVSGVAMTFVFWLAGAGSLIAAVAAACLADAMPALLFEWGHTSLVAHFPIILSLALYVASLKRPWSAALTGAWTLLLAGTMLIHIYTLVMVGAIWAASVTQAWLDQARARNRILGQAMMTAATLVAIGFAAGFLSSETSGIGTDQFGVFSLNLASPFIPQYSGVIPPLRHYLVGMHSQQFGYPGFGVEAVWAAAMAGLLAGAGDFKWRRHVALILVLAGCFLFALSNRITLGSHQIIHIPLPQSLLFALGTFRASGRFIWPILYATAAAAVVSILSWRNRRLAVGILAAASLFQWIDADPLRHEAAQSTLHADPEAIDRQSVLAFIAGTSAVSVFPSTACMEERTEDTAFMNRLLRIHVEIELLASRNIQILNNVYKSRGAADCTRQAADRAGPLRPNESYIYLFGPAPSAEQLGGQDAMSVCRMISGFLACKL